MRITGKLANNIAHIFRQISRQADHLFYWDSFIEMYNDDFLEVELKQIETKIARIRKFIKGE